MQLAARIRPRDLEEFFSTVGKVINREAKMIPSTSSSCPSTGLMFCRIVSKWLSRAGYTGGKGMSDSQLILDGSECENVIDQEFVCSVWCDAIPIQPASFF